jgi:hypothetical protein
VAKVVERADMVVGGLPVGGSTEAGDLVGWSGQQIVRASGAAGGSIPAIGVALAAYRAGDTGAIALRAEVSGLSGLTRGQTHYLSTSTAGSTQATAPSSAGMWKQKVGFPTAADRMLFHLQDEGASV